MNQASQEGARRQDDAASADFRARFREHAGTRSTCIEKNVRNRVSANFQIGLLGQQRLHGLAIELAIGLGTRPANSGSF